MNETDLKKPDGRHTRPFRKTGDMHLRQLRQHSYAVPGAGRISQQYQLWRLNTKRCLPFGQVPARPSREACRTSCQRPSRTAPHRLGNRKRPPEKTASKFHVIAPVASRQHPVQQMSFMSQGFQVSPMSAGTARLKSPLMSHIRRIGAGLTFPRVGAVWTTILQAGAHAGPQSRTASPTCRLVSFHFLVLAALWMRSFSHDASCGSGQVAQASPFSDPLVAEIMSGSMVSTWGDGDTFHHSPTAGLAHEERETGRLWKACSTFRRFIRNSAKRPRKSPLKSRLRVFPTLRKRTLGAGFPVLKVSLVWFLLLHSAVQAGPETRITTNPPVAPDPLAHKTVESGQNSSPASAVPARTTTDLLTFIRTLEAPRGYGDYERRIRIPPPKPLTAMTVGEVLDWQVRLRRAGAISTAVGGYQIILNSAVGAGTISDKLLMLSG